MCTRIVDKNRICIISHICKGQTEASYVYINFCMLRDASDSPTSLQALFLYIYTLAVLVHVHTERYRKGFESSIVAVLMGMKLAYIADLI